jgi:ATP-binding cassette, subfamily F, member 3
VPILAGTNLSLAYGERVILRDVTLSIEATDRIGIVGRNGTGKSTLLKILAGIQKQDTGSVSLQKGYRVGYLTQDPTLDPEETLREAAEGAFERLHSLHKQLDQVYEKMMTATGDALDQLMKDQIALETDMEAAGGYAIEHKIEAVLHGVGFTDAQFGIKTKNLSGGQKGRLSLARLLLESPDAILLDEPTNHLDIEGRIWLEEFLNSEFKGAVVMISHDRYLLDNVVNRIIEVEQCRLIDYPGNYEAFREIRAQRRLTMHRAYEAQQSKFKKEEEYIRRFKAGQRARQAKGRESRLDREKEQNRLERPMEMAQLRLSLPKAERTSDVVISARGMSKSYTNEEGAPKVLFRELDLVVNRGERWGIIGPNGAGKTTLVRCILGDLAPDAGQVRLGSNIKVGYYRQMHEEIPTGVPVYRYLQGVIMKEAPQAAFSEQQARNLAGSFLFTGDEQERDMDRLSGGERTRAVLAGLLSSAKNVLVLDEPTNHLDIQASERLEDALAKPDEDNDGFEGTVIIISHDRALIDATCDHLLVLDGKGGAQTHLGGFTDWYEKQKSMARDKAQADAKIKDRAKKVDANRVITDYTAPKAKTFAPSSESNGSGEPRSNQDRGKGGTQTKPPGAKGASTGALARLTTEQLEQKIEKIEGRLREIDTQLQSPDVWRDARKSNELSSERGRVAAELEPLEFEWARRAEEA